MTMTPWAMPPRSGHSVIQILQFLNDEEGAVALEYALLAGLIIAAMVAAVTNLGQIAKGFFEVAAVGW